MATQIHEAALYVGIYGIGSSSHRRCRSHHFMVLRFIASMAHEIHEAASIGGLLHCTTKQSLK